MTLIELLVAMTLGLIVTLIALSMLVLGRTGYSTVDSTTQLLDKERFAVDTISRLVMQAGYQDYAAEQLTTRFISYKLGESPEPDLFAWNNTIYKSPAVLVDMSQTPNMVDGNRPGLCTVNDTSCKNGSDVLLVRFQGGGTTAAPDQTMVNCMGNPEPGPVTGDINERSANMVYVDRDASGEPSLKCAYYNFASGAWVNGQPLLEGVESMQLLFGTDDVTAATAPPLPPLPTAEDMIVDRWLRADQLKVAGNPVGTKGNWRRVRAVRVGLVLRGPPGSAQERVSETFRPLGAQYTDAADTGAVLVTAADGRLRRVLNFTVHLRNDLSTR